MNKIILVITLFFISPVLMAQELIRLTETPYKRPAAVKHITFTSDTSYLSIIADSAIGTTFPQSMGNTHIDHRNLQGDLLWQYIFKGQVGITSIVYDASGNTLFTGAYADTLRIGDSTYANGDPYDNASLFGQLNSSGQLEWIVVEDTLGDNIATAITPVPNGYILCGINELSGGFIRFYNASHELQWAKCYSKVRTTSSILYHPVDQAVYLTGNCEPYAQFDTVNVGDPPSAGYLSYLAKFDLDGNIYWVNTAPYVTFDLENKLGLAGNEVFLFEGIDTTASNLSMAYQLSTVNSGSAITHKFILPPIFHYIPAVNFDHNETGLSYRTYGSMDVTTIVYDSALNVRYQSDFPYHTTGFEITNCAHRKDMMLVAGTFYTDSFSLENKTIYSNPDPEQQSTYLAVIKHGAVHTGLDDKILGKNDVIVYPNPASSNIHFSYPQGKHYTITLTDLAGKTIASSAELSMNIESVISGLYIMDIYDTENHIHSYQKLLIRK